MSPHTTSLLIEKMPMTKTVQKMAECQNVLTAENASLWAKIENKKVIMLDGSGENEMNMLTVLSMTIIATCRCKKFAIVCQSQRCLSRPARERFQKDVTS